MGAYLVRAARRWGIEALNLTPLPSFEVPSCGFVVIKTQDLAPTSHSPSFIFLSHPHIPEHPVIDSRVLTIVVLPAKEQKLPGRQRGEGEVRPWGRLGGLGDGHCCLGRILSTDLE